MSSYSKTQEEAIKDLATGKELSQKGGKFFIGEKIYRSTSIEALSRRGVVKQENDKYYLTEQGKARANALSSVGENLTDHRPNRLQFRWFDNHNRPTFDIGQCDYEWWDRARRGKVDGFSIAGLFLKPIASKRLLGCLANCHSCALMTRKPMSLSMNGFGKITRIF